MTGEGFTILHASDFQLDVPLGGLRWIPEAIKAEVLGAPEVAAQRAFDFALQHQVDLMALTGNLLCPTNSSARSLSFLEEQFTRMHEHGIPVVWATGSIDPLEAWPTSMIWPDSTIRFDRGSVGRRVMTLGGIDVEVLGCGSDAAGNIHPEWFDGLSRGERQLVIGGGTVDSFKKLDASDLWVLGGRNYAEHLVDGNASMFYAGVPQGRCLSDSGPRGAQLIHVHDKIELTKLDCAAIRYERINIQIDSINNIGDLELTIFNYVEANSWESDCITLVHWDVDCKQSTNAFLDTSTEFMQWQQLLAQRAMSSNSAVYSIGVNVHGEQGKDVATDGEDLLSDYLFALETLRENGWSTMQLNGTADSDDTRRPWMAVEEDLEGLRTLDDSARLGELLLGGANPQSEPPVTNIIESETA